MTREDLRRVVLARPCRDCGQPLDAAVHMNREGSPRCHFRLDDEAFIDQLIELFARDFA